MDLQVETEGSALTLWTTDSGQSFRSPAGRRSRMMSRPSSLSWSADFLLTPGPEEPAPEGGTPALTWVALTGQLSRWPSDLSSLRKRTDRAHPVPTDKPEPAPQARQRQRRLTAAEAVAVAQEYLAGATMRELARRFNVHRTTISSCLHQLAVPLRRQGLREDDLAELARLYQEGWSLARLGEKYDCDDETVRQFLLRHGVAMRPRRGGPKRKSA
jgi:lambda repressor-like predicted transcriptional regulator